MDIRNLPLGFGKPIQPGSHPVIGNDLTRVNIEHDIPAAGLEAPGISENPFPLGVYPVFDDDVPRDNSFDNFMAPDLKDLHPYPWGLRRQYGEEKHETEAP